MVLLFKKKKINLTNLKKKIILLGFASSDLTRSVKRFKSQAEKSNYYDQIIVHTEKNLDKFCNTQIKNIIKLYGKRGYGYWFWKPYLISKVLDQINNNDILHYLDIGCHIIENKHNNFTKFINILENDQSGILGFQYNEPTKEIDPAIDFPRREEFKYTKADLLNYFNFLDNLNIVNSPQFWGGCIFIKKNSFSEKFINEWLNIFSKNLNLVNDSESKINNLNGFIENRHDQSIYSLLCKKYNVTSLSAYDFDWAIKQNKRCWEQTSESPFVAYRDLEYSMLRRFINRQKKNIRRFIKNLK